MCYNRKVDISFSVKVHRGDLTMEKTLNTISSISYKENLGTAELVIEGEIPVSDEFDDPIVELFRPIREKHKKDILFAILVFHKQDENTTVCKLVPSNRRNRDESTLLDIANSALKGEDGIIAEYRQILEAFFSDEKGLNSFVAKVKAAEEAKETNKTALYDECNNTIKDFVEYYGLKMPSLKPKAKKTRAQKKADAEAYRAKHPEIVKK